MDRKITVYLSNFNITPTFDPWNGNVVLRDNGDGVVRIVKWDIPEAPQPTPELLDTITDEQVLQFEKDQQKAKFAAVQANLIRTEPKFALVYDMMRALSTRSDESWNAKCKEVFDAWVDKQFQ